MYKMKKKKGHCVNLNKLMCERNCIYQSNIYMYIYVSMYHVCIYIYIYVWQSIFFFIFLSLQVSTTARLPSRFETVSYSRDFWNRVSSN